VNLSIKTQVIRGKPMTLAFVPKLAKLIPYTSHARIIISASSLKILLAFRWTFIVRLPQQGSKERLQMGRQVHRYTWTQYVHLNMIPRLGIYFFIRDTIIIASLNLSRRESIFAN